MVSQKIRRQEVQNIETGNKQKSFPVSLLPLAIVATATATAIAEATATVASPL